MIRKGSQLRSWKRFGLTRRSGNWIPGWLSNAYDAAMYAVVPPALTHLRNARADADVRSLIAALAYAKGQPRLGAIALWTEDERREAMGHYCIFPPKRH